MLYGSCMKCLKVSNLSGNIWTTSWKNTKFHYRFWFWQTLRRTPLVSSWKGIFWKSWFPVSRCVHIISTSSLHHNPITLFEQHDRHGKRLLTSIYGSPPQSIIEGHIVSNTIGSQGSFGKYRGTLKTISNIQKTAHIICKIAWILCRKGVTMKNAPFMLSIVWAALTFLLLERVDGAKCLFIFVIVFINLTYGVLKVL